MINFELITPASYLVLTILYLVITIICLKKIRRFKVLGGAVMVLPTILVIDALRTLFESIYFGFYFSSLYGLLSKNIYELLATPYLVIIPKLVNMIAGLLILYLLIHWWSPRKTDELRDIDKREKLASKVFKCANEAITITDITGEIMEVNEAFTRITGYSRSELIGKNPRLLKSGKHSPEFYEEMWASLINDGLWKGEIWNKRKNGEVYPEMLTISSVLDPDGTVQNYIGLFTDITMIKEHERELEYIAYYDTLTSLPNRRFLVEHLSKSLIKRQLQNTYLAVVFLDLDMFKVVNDTYGHDVGDELLIIVSRRMKNALRSFDTLSRIGGDEFVAIIENLSNIEDCEMALKRLLKAASKPMKIAGVELQVSASIGVAIYPQNGSDMDLLLRNADQAMYFAKQNGKNRYQFFEDI